MRNSRKFLMALGAALIALPQVASAQYSFFSGDAGDFVTNTATVPFMTAIGGSADEHLTFDNLMNGTASGSLSSTNGSGFSNNVRFRTVSSGFGGITGPDVNWANPADDSEIGPFNGWGGTLVIDFLGAGTLANAVGFGGVEFTGATNLLRIYDQNGLLAYSGTAADHSLSDFSFFGAVSTGATKIGRVEMDGNFFAIQDISIDYAASASVVPEPSTYALTGFGLLVAFGAARRRRKA